MQTFIPENLKNLYVPPPISHKGQNGKLMIIGGSKLFHAASLWALKVASRIVDMVYYSSVDENNQIIQKAKEEFRDGIVVKRSQIESYIEEADCVLIGPGMVRSSKLNSAKPNQSSNPQLKTQSLDEIDTIEDEGVQTYYLTKYVLEKYSNKKWVIDAGSLQMMEREFIPKNAILTPHRKEFDKLFKLKTQFGKAESKLPPAKAWHWRAGKTTTQKSKVDEGSVREMARKYKCVILLKGQTDIVCSSSECVQIEGGNAGMTKGGTGDVLAGLVAALYCKNDAFLSSCAGSYINKKAGDELYKRVGYYFNASDLADEIPRVMKELILQ